MGFFGSDLGRAAVGWTTGGLSEVYRALNPGNPQQGYSPLPFDYGANNAVDHGRIGQELQNALGRPATQDEIDQYSKYIQTGDLQYGDIGRIVQGLPEAQQARLAQQQGQYQNLLTANNQSVLNQAAATANGQFAQNGRQWSSGQGNSILQAGQQLAAQQSPMIANFYGQGQMGLNSAYQSAGQDTLQRAYNLTDSRTAYNRSLLGYQTQRNDYGTDLSNQRAYNRGQAFNQLVGGGIGAAVGSLGGPAGAQIGAGLGSRAGGLFGGY